MAIDDAERLGARRRGRPGYNLEAVLDGAVEVFNERGYDRTRVEDVARRLGVSKSAIYHHVTGKEQLLGLALDRALDGLFAVADDVTAAGGRARRSTRAARPRQRRRAQRSAAVRHAAGARSRRHGCRAAGTAAAAPVRSARCRPRRRGGRRWRRAAGHRPGHDQPTAVRDGQLTGRVVPPAPASVSCRHRRRRRTRRLRRPARPRRRPCDDACAAARRMGARPRPQPGPPRRVLSGHRGGDRAGLRPPRPPRRRADPRALRRPQRGRRAMGRRGGVVVSAELRRHGGGTVGTGIRGRRRVRHDHAERDVPGSRREPAPDLPVRRVDADLGRRQRARRRLRRAGDARRRAPRPDRRPAEPLRHAVQLRAQDGVQLRLGLGSAADDVRAVATGRPRAVGRRADPLDASTSGRGHRRARRRRARARRRRRRSRSRRHGSRPAGAQHGHVAGRQARRQRRGHAGR